MKKLILAIPLLFAAVLAHADLVIEQKIESAFLNGNSVTKMKGDQMKIDTPLPGGQSVTMIVDANTGDATTLMHAQKMAMKMNLNAMMKQAQKATGGTPDNPANATKPKATGTKEKVGEHEAEIYEMTAAGQTIRLWAAKEFPKASAYKDQMSKLAKATSGGQYDPAQFDIPGMIVKTELSTPQGKMTTTLVSIREEAVADSEFQIPTGYQDMQLPQQQ